MSEQGTENQNLPELTPEQISAGKEIAEYCGINEDTLKQKMLWRGSIETVEYGLAHSAQYMDHLTTEEILDAVNRGITEYQLNSGNSSKDY